MRKSYYNYVIGNIPEYAAIFKLVRVPRRLRSDSRVKIGDVIAVTTGGMMQHIGTGNVFVGPSYLQFDRYARIVIELDFSITLIEGDNNVT